MLIGIVQILVGIFILGILVLIHEFGHFIAAKSFGIRVLAFSIGFGKPLLKKSFGDTEYRISSIPFGGYVHMAGEHPEDSHQGTQDEFTSKPIWQRAVIAIAGPAANIIFSFIFLWIVFFKGIPHDVYLDSPVVGAVEDSSAASIQGLKAGDSIVSINNEPVSSWEDIQNHFSRMERAYTITFVRSNTAQSATITMPSHKEGTIPDNLTGGLLPAYPALIGKVNKGSAGMKAGLQPNDSIIAIDNQRIYSWYQLLQIVSHYDPLHKDMQLVVQRGDSSLVIPVEPEFNSAENRYLIGIAVAIPQTRTIRYSAAEAVPKAGEKTWEYTTMIFDVLKKLANRTVSPKQLSGPVGIIQMSGVVAFGSFVGLLNFMALIGINLGILNLLPLIITDGGVLLFLIIEAIRNKPLSLKTQSLINRIAVAFFILLFLYVTKNDIFRIPQIFGLIGK